MIRLFGYGAVMIVMSLFPSKGITVETYRGIAYERENSTPVYSESFTDTFVNGQHTETLTDYFDPENKHIATRHLDFSRSSFAPDFRTEDRRTGFTEGAEVNGTRVKLFNRKDRQSPILERIIDIPEPVVVDGGFNHLIKANWTLIEKGEPLIFYFAVPCKLDYYKLRALKIHSSSSLMTIRIEPDQAIFRWIAAPINVTYDRNTKRIVSYEGKSNIIAPNGENFIVKLVYPEKGP